MAQAQTAGAHDGSYPATDRTRRPTDAGNAGIMVVVQDAWNGWRTATVMMTDLDDIQWLQPDGAPRPLIHAYVSCTKVQRLDCPNDCDTQSGPHALLVCILRRHTVPHVFEQLARRADRGDTTITRTTPPLD